MSTSADQFVAAGTLPSPGLPGRLLRLLSGLVILIFALPPIIQSIPGLPQAETVPADILFWLAVLFTFLNMHYVINLGLGRSWGRKPQMIFLLLVGTAAAVSLALYGRLWAPPLATLIVFWLILINAPLGVAFVLAAALRTPGCEMRSYHHLLARHRNQDPTEHFCPGGIDFADKWEIRLRHGFRG